jgi:ABC-type antimicrobial peptide transport system permease subunit
MADALRQSLWGAVASASLLAAFAMVALLLAATGIYGVVVQMVQQRRYEMGIRIALGARSRGVVALVVRRGMTPVLLGVTAGAVLAAASTRLLASLLYGLSGTEVGVFLIAAGVLGAVAFLACLLPARAATRVDPMLTLRDG